MKLARMLFIGYLIFTAVSVGGVASAQSLNGEWDWSDAPSSRTFSVSLKQHGQQLVGQYCAVARNGNKVDCDDDGNPNIKGVVNKTGQMAIVKFSSFFGARNGQAVLNIKKNRLTWRITENPVSGEFYAPQDAILDRQ